MIIFIKKKNIALIITQAREKSACAYDEITILAMNTTKAQNHRACVRVCGRKID